MTLRSLIAATRARLPRRTDKVVVTRDLAVPMRDGTILRADLWAPRDDEGARTLVIVRTPYGSAGMGLIGRLLAERGHLLLVQNCRGTFSSGGRFVPFHDEFDDGLDLLAWLDDQAWARRPLATMGASYTGYTAYTLVAAAPERVTSLALAVTSADFHTAVMYPDQVVGSETALIWIGGLLAQELPLLPKLLAVRRITHGMRSALLASPAQADTVLLGRPYPPYQEWIRHDGAEDPWWDAFDRRPQLRHLAPSALVAGWYDPFLVGQLDDYAAVKRERRPARLVVGPWTHAAAGVADTLVRESLRLLADSDSAEGASVYDAGTKRWQALPHWPPATVGTTLFLSGRSRLRNRVSSPVDAAWSVNVADPPPPAGGRALNPAFAGRRRQSPRERRPDVRVFTSARLRRSTIVAGSPTVRLRVRGTDRSQEWFVRLCDVDRFGVSRNICDGYLLQPAGDGSTTVGQERNVTIRLAPTAYTFRRGHRIRLQISGSGYPFHPAPLGGAPDRGLISRTDAPSILELPVVRGGWRTAPRGAHR